MKQKINFSKVTAADVMRGEDEEETEQMKELLVKAKKYLSSFNWCREIVEAYYGLGIGRPLGVFLFKIIPTRKDVDEWIWVIAGDLPPAYITTDDAPNPASALDAYIGAMRQWVEAVKAGRSVDGLVPVNVPPTLKWANQLETRLHFIQKEILAFHTDDLNE